MLNKLFFIGALYLNTLILYSQWEIEYHAAYGETLEHISVVDSNIVWVIGRIGITRDTSIIYERISPNVWTEIYGEFRYNNRLTCVAGLDSLTAFIGTDLGKVFRTTDSGNNWDLIINTGGNGYINDIKFSRTNSNVGYIFGDPPQGPNTAFKIYKTTDRGLTWDTLGPVFGGTYYGNEKSGYVTDSLHAWFGLNCQPSFCGISKIAQTTDGGLSWFTSSINGANYIWGLAFRYDNQFGLCAPGDQYPTTKIYVTQNNGTNWVINYNSLLSQPISSICYVKGTSVWYYCSPQIGTQIHKSSDNGLSWFPMSANSGEQTYYIDAVNQNNKIFAFCITYQGSILKLQDTVFAIGIKNKSNKIPKLSNLYQNYPNPFNPSTTIKFDLPVYTHVSLKVYNVLGKEIEILLDEHLKVGSYEIEWNAKDFPSGIYFYRILAGDYTNSHKMIFVK